MGLGSSINFRICFLFFSTFAYLAHAAVLVRDENPNPYTVNPSYEGSYAVKIECRETPVSAECKNIEGKTDLTIVNLGQKLGVTATLVHPKVDMPLYKFAINNISNSGGILSGNSTKFGGKLADIYIELNPTNKNILAYIRDAQFQADLRITGTQTISPGYLYREVKEMLSAAEIQGKYIIKIGTHQGVLSIRRTLSGTPTFFAKYLENGATIDFDYGEFFPEDGVLNLVHSPASLKWTLAIDRDDKQGLRFQGLGVSGDMGGGYDFEGVSAQ